MDAPTLVSRDAESVTVKWAEMPGAASYEVGLREGGGGAEWVVIAASLKQTIVRKKNLKSRAG